MADKARFIMCVLASTTPIFACYIMPQVRYCYDEESLKQLIAPKNLTMEFGGNLYYDHSHWIYIKTVGYY